MNERIKELAEQAGMKPCADMSKFGMNEDMNPYNCQEFMLEKFAELIIHECLIECWYDYTPKQISDNIKRKFGVE